MAKAENVWKGGQASKATPEEAAKVYRETGFNLSETTRRLGYSPASRHAVRRVLKKAREDGFLESTAGRNSENLSTLSPIADLVAKQKRAYEQKKKSGSWRKPHVVKLDYKGPFMVCFLGDEHVDDDGTDLDALDHWIDILDEQERIYGFSLGDWSNNWLRFLGILYGEQTITADEGWELVKHYIKKAAPHMVGSVGGNHDCVSIDTELLTKRGWKTYLEFNYSDEVLGLNENGVAEWQTIQKVIIKPAQKRDMYLVDNARASMLVTGRHRILHRKKNGGYAYARAEEGVPAQSAIPTCGTVAGVPSGLDQKTLYVMGMLQADGCCSKGRWSLSQSKNCPEVDDALADMGLSYTLQTRVRDIKSICGRMLKKPPLPSRDYRFHASSGRRLSALIPDRYKIPEAVRYATPEDFAAWLRGFLAGDGSPNSTGTGSTVYGRESFLSELQGVLVTKGYSANLRRDKRGHYCLGIFSSGEYTPAKLSLEKQEYSGPVWCLQVPLTNFMVRRKGKPFFTGNSWDKGEHALGMVMADLGVPHRPDGMRISFKQKGCATEPITIGSRHAFSGTSIYNTAHGVMRAAIFGWQDTLLVGGHLHVSGSARVKNPDTGYIVHCEQVASFKIIDRYADQKGLMDKHISPAVAYVFQPWFKADDPRRAIRFDDPEDAKMFLEASRTRFEG